MKKNLKNIADEIVAAYDARVKIVGEIVEDTHKTIDGFREKREQMSQNLREALAKNESLRKKDFDYMMIDILAKQAEREKHVKNMLQGLHKEEKMVAEKLRELLSKGENIRIRDFKKMMADIRQEQENRSQETGDSISEELQKMREEVYAMLDTFKKERQSVASAWQEALSLFRGERNLVRLSSDQKNYEKGNN